MNNDLTQLEEIIHYQFKNKELLAQAVTHSSRANELTGNPFDGNERLEFLGDAVLEEIMSACLFFGLPDKPEGVLTKLRAAIVCEPSLATAAKNLRLNDFIRLGKGEEHTGGRDRDSIVSDCLEAIFGAVFLDGGRDAAKQVIELVLSEIARMAIEGKLSKDAKTDLQEYLQKKGSTQIQYRITGESGPAHNKEFEAEVSADGVVLGTGVGKSKQAAQTAAAAQALAKLKSR